MDQSDNQTASTSGVREIITMEPRQIEPSDDDDGGCNWDIEVIQFVVDSFICLFPERDCDGRCGACGQRCGHCRARAYKKTHSDMSTGSNGSARSTRSNRRAPTDNA